MAKFSLSNIDRQPLGDIAGVMIILICANPETDFIYSHKTDKGEYRFSTVEVKQELGIKNLNDNSLPCDIREMINNNLDQIGVSDFKEIYQK